MNITSKANEIREAVQNLNNLTEGLRGLSDAIIPKERIQAVVSDTVSPWLEQQDDKINNVLSTCENTTGEAVQLINTVQSHMLSRLEKLEEQVADLTETLDTLANAATRKRRAK